MTHPMPENAAQIIRDAAELGTYRFIVRRLYTDHQRMANSQKFDICLCSTCQAVRPFIPVEEPQFCTELDERERVS